MLRDFQQELENGVFQAWDEGAINVMMVGPTGSGKTVTLGDIIMKVDQPTCAIAHRQELVTQLALALNREKVPHGIIAPKATVQEIIAVEMETHEYSCFNPRAACRVAGVDTLIKRDASDRWFQQVLLGIIDEGHHVLRNNKWGRAFGFLSNARGLFTTAHAFRADGAGLGRNAETADGLVDRLVVGPCGRNLINRGFLTDYRLVCPPSHINLERVKLSTTGDFNHKDLARAVHEDGAIVGDVVREYLRLAGGKRGISFAVDLASAAELADAYNKAGVPAAVITGETHVKVRSNLMKKFRNGQLLQLVSVDVLGEGVDVPAVEVISMARPTASFQLYAQQFGRALRLMLEGLTLPSGHAVADVWHLLTDEQRLYYISISKKPKAIIIDHVGNWARFFPDHGFVDSPQAYILNRRERKTRQKEFDPDFIPQRSCLFCFLTYESVEPVCPHCGQAHIPQGRSKPAQVDGDLFELAPEILAAMRGERDKLDQATGISWNKNDVVANSIAKANRDRQAAQVGLRNAMALWAGWQKHLGRTDAEGYRRFFYKFGVDAMTAQALSTVDASNLESRIRGELHQHNIVGMAV
jgi:DNA repair protein RadD